MSPDSQRIAIAEACGWEVINDTLCNVRPDRNGDPEIEPVAPLPNYLADLNAMHEAEKTLKDLILYRRFLYLVVLEDPSNVSNEPAWATAAQRAEAFLRTVGKWEGAK